MASPLSRTKQTQLDAFMLRVMEPLTEGELVDTQYNSLARQARFAAWSLAERVTMYYSALRKAASYAGAKDVLHLAPGCTLPPYGTILIAWRAAVARQLLTPASQKADIDWKKRQDITYLPVDAEDVTRAIAADEAFLAAHPVRVSKRRAAE